MNESHAILLAAAGDTDPKRRGGGFKPLPGLHFGLVWDVSFLPTGRITTREAATTPAPIAPSRITMNPSFADCPLSPGEDLLSRRRFMGTSLVPCLPARGGRCRRSKKRLRVAAIYSVFSYRGHAHVLLQNFLKPYYFCGRLTNSDMDVVSFHADQIAPRGDMTRDVARQFGVEVFPTVESALCRGGKELAVDAVLSIFEQGDYPFNELGQQLTRAKSTSMKS